MNVINCHSIKEGNPAVVTGNDGIKGVVEFQRGVQAIAEPSKAIHRSIINTYACP